MKDTKVPVQVFGGTTKFDKKLFTPVSKDVNYYINKPFNGGLWTSSYIEEKYREEDYDKKDYSEWARWFINENFHIYSYEDISILYPKEDTKVFTINNIEDLYEASSRLGDICDDKLLKHNIARADNLVIDFQKLSKSYDGIRVTKEGAWRLHWFDDSIYDNDKYRMLISLNAWDCESTLWFNVDWIDKVEYKKVKMK